MSGHSAFILGWMRRRTTNRIMDRTPVNMPKTKTVIRVTSSSSLPEALGLM